MPSTESPAPRRERALALLEVADQALLLAWRAAVALATVALLASGVALGWVQAGRWGAFLEVLGMMHLAAAALVTLHLAGWMLSGLLRRRAARRPGRFGRRVLHGTLAALLLLLAATGFARFAAVHYGLMLPWGLTALHAGVLHTLLAPLLLSVLVLWIMRILRPVVAFLRQQ